MGHYLPGFDQHFAGEKDEASGCNILEGTSFDDPIHSVLYKVVSIPFKQSSEANTIILLIIPYYTVSLLYYTDEETRAGKFSVSWPKISNLYITVR